MEGITYIEHFLGQPDHLFSYLETNAGWDSSMAARKTASYGVSYNYSQITYPYQEMLSPLQDVATAIESTIGFLPNNCLINYYLDGKSKMGFHSDQTDILAENTGVAIVSLGETRTLRFRNIADKELIVDYPLPSGSLIYMTQAIQDSWHHAIPKSDTDLGRMSLTFRKIV
jgi:alkylated DNA repair dioxygenase AlkB